MAACSALQSICTDAATVSLVDVVRVAQFVLAFHHDHVGLVCQSGTVHLSYPVEKLFASGTTGELGLFADASR